MEKPRHFDGYLLFREGDTNAYRTSYRAGVARGRAIDRIVRVEVFDRPGVDTDRLAASLNVSQGLQGRLKDPHIAKGAGVGRVGDIPYAAYDFELGSTLASFLDLTRFKSFPMPFDQALFIVERIALALAAGHRVEHNGGPVRHTFLTPDSVLLSNEGQVKVLGFETATGLREQFAGEVEYAPYLAPECRTGEAAGSRGDVYSLAAILFELIAGKTCSGDPPETDALVMQPTGEPISDGLRRLLDASFAPRFKRVPNVLEWQQGLGKLILAGEYNPTTFNLAFMMHTIMRDRLEQDVAEIRQEKSFLLTPESESELSAKTTSEEPDPEAAEPAPEEATAELEVSSTNTLPETPIAVQQNAAAERRPFWLGFAVSAVVGGGVLGALLASGGPGPPDAAATAVVASTPPPATSLIASDPAGTQLRPAEAASVIPTPASEVAPESASGDASGALVLTEVVNGELGDAPVDVVDVVELERLVAERAKEIEQNLKAEYESKLATLGPRGDAPTQATQAIPTPPLDAGNAAGSSASAARVPEGQNPASEGRLAVSTPPPGDASDPGGAPETSGGSSASSDAGTVVPAEIASRDADAEEPAAAVPTARLEAPVEAAPLPVGREAEVREPMPRVARLEPPSQPVVTKPPQLLRLGTPNYPPLARRLGLSARVRVKVQVDVDGKVVSAEVLGPEIGNGFDAAALATVRRSRWEPGLENGESVESWTSVAIEFRP